MTAEPRKKKTLVLFDGQNLFNAVKDCFGYHYPNYNPLTLAQVITQNRGWQLAETRFYTGVPHPKDDAAKADFWKNKLNSLKHRGIFTYKGNVRYHNNNIRLNDGSIQRVRIGYEKGVDVRIALDAISLTRKQNFDVVLFFSQDQDLSEAAEEIRSLAKEQNRWIKVASAFPFNPAKRTIGINKTDWIKVDKATYDACIDSKDYRSKKFRT